MSDAPQTDLDGFVRQIDGRVTTLFERTEALGVSIRGVLDAANMRIDLRIAENRSLDGRVSALESKWSPEAYIELSTRMAAMELGKGAIDSDRTENMKARILVAELEERLDAIASHPALSVPPLASPTPCGRFVVDASYVEKLERIQEAAIRVRDGQKGPVYAGYVLALEDTINALEKALNS